MHRHRRFLKRGMQVALTALAVLVVVALPGG